MPHLTMVITNQTNTDYDGVNETVKNISGDIDGIILAEKCSCASTETDASCKTSFKTLLTDKGYIWDTES